MKDLATLRNPQSPYTFLNYLHSQGRLVSFINRGSTVPTRKEYSDYLSWAAQRVQDKGVNVCYGHEVVGIESVDDTIAVRYRNLSTGEEVIVRSRMSSPWFFLGAANSIVFSRQHHPRSRRFSSCPDICSAFSEAPASHSQFSLRNVHRQYPCNGI